MFKNHAYTFVVSSRSFCAGNNASIPCNGDSGSGFYVIDPATYGFKLLGIVSQGINANCNPMDMVVFVDVPKFMPWIDESELTWIEI
jgi:secreted trypsin-like serine protease